jgi:hypothetical protein
MKITKLWRYGLLVLCVGYGVAIGCGPLQESSSGLAGQRAGIDNQCSPPALVTDLNPGPCGRVSGRRHPLALGLPGRVPAAALLRRQ